MNKQSNNTGNTYANTGNNNYMGNKQYIADSEAYKIVDDILNKRK